MTIKRLLLTQFFLFPFLLIGQEASPSLFYQRLDNLRSLGRSLSKEEKQSLANESQDIFKALTREGLIERRREFFREIAFRFHELLGAPDDNHEFLIKMGNILFLRDDFTKLGDLELYDHLWYVGFLQRSGQLSLALTFLEELELYLSTLEIPSERAIVEQMRLQLPIKKAHLLMETSEFSLAEAELLKIYKDSEEEALFTSIHRQKENSYALQELALVKMRLQKYQEAKKILLSKEFHEKKQYLHPNYRRFDLYLAEIYLSEGDMKEALKCMRRYKKDEALKHEKNRVLHKEMKKKI